MIEEVIGQSYKLFYLVDDYANSVFEKVYLCDNYVIKSIMYGLKEKVKIFGLLGPVQSIYKHLARYYTDVQLEGQQKGKQQVKIKLNDNLKQLANCQKPAVYLIKLPEKNKDYDTIFLALISNNELYYNKPFDQNSLVYLLIRFMGDLCNDIILLYDTEIQKKFNEKENPYLAMANDETVFTLKTIKLQNIKIIQVPCVSNEIVERGCNMQNIDFRHSLVLSNTSYLQYFNKIDQNTFERHINQSRSEKKLHLWKAFIEEKFNQLQFFFIKEKDQSKDAKQYTQTLSKLKTMSKETKKLIQKLFEQAVKNIQHLVVGEQGRDVTDEKIKEEVKKNFDLVYFYTVLSPEVRPKIISNQFVIGNTQFIISKLVSKVIEIIRILHPTLQVQQFSSKISQKINNIWHNYQNQLLEYYHPFLQHSEKLINLSENALSKNEKISITRIEMIKTKKDNVLSKIQFRQQENIDINICDLRKLIKGVTLNTILDIKIFKFKTKYSRNVKVAVVSRKLEDINIRQYTFLLIEKNDMKVIVKYQQEQLIFTFDQSNRKIYLLKPNEGVLLTFVLDEIDIQRAKNQKKYSLDKETLRLKIVSYSVSKNPHEKFYYLDSSGDILFCYNITTQQNIQIYSDYFQSTSTGKQTFKLDCSKGKYNIVRAFSNNIYIALGSQKIIDIFQVELSGQLKFIHCIEVLNTGICKGISTYSDERNQYLIIYQQNCFRAFCFENMSSSNYLQQENQKRPEGNPIIDIFYEARDRFGGYTPYTVCQNTLQQKSLNLLHVLPTLETQNKINKYMSQYQIKKHVHYFYLHGKIFELYKNQKHGLICRSYDFINETQTRIPIQICSVEAGNIITLKDGTITDNYDGHKATIEVRSRMLTFGVVQRLLLEDQQKKTIVVSIMGAQSTGKSYLLNRIFGTRFTVASCRTTIGIWISVVKTKSINFVILDCEGLFSVQRQLHQEQKLIKILTSISDFTILNQNKSTTNKSLTQLMSNIASSIKRNVHKNLINSKQLYNGQLIIIVRDVTPNQHAQIRSQFQNNFYEKSEIKEFLLNAFNSKNSNEKREFSFFPFPSYIQNEAFTAKTIEMRNKFIKKSEDRETRNSRTILKWLKIVLCQLACDDNDLPQQILIKMNVQAVQQNMRNAWKKGDQKYSHEEEIQTYRIQIMDQDIQIGQSNQIYSLSVINQTNSCLQEFIQIVKNQLQGYKINSVNFARYYRSLNEIIKSFFARRHDYALETFKNEVKMLEITDQKLKQKLKNNLEDVKKKIYNIIKDQQQKLQFCLQTCSEKCCQQPCIKNKDHQYHIENQLRLLKTKKDAHNKWLKKNPITQQQRKKKQADIEQLVRQEEYKLDEYQYIMKNYQQKLKLEKKIFQIQQNFKEKDKEVNQLKTKIKGNNKYYEKYKERLNILLNTFKLTENITTKFDSSTENGEYLVQIRENIAKLSSYIRNINNEIYNPTQTKEWKRIFEKKGKEKERFQIWLNKEKKNKKQLSIRLDTILEQLDKERKKLQKLQKQIQEGQKEMNTKICEKDEKIQLCKQKDKQIEQFTEKIKHNELKIVEFNQKSESLIEQLKKYQKERVPYQQVVKVLSQKEKHNIYSKNGLTSYLIPTILGLIKQKQQNIIIPYRKYIINKKYAEQMRKKLKIQQLQSEQKTLESIKVALKKNLIRARINKNDKQMVKINEDLNRIEELQKIEKILPEKIQIQQQQVQNLRKIFENEENYEQLLSIIKSICTIELPLAERTHQQNYGNKIQFEIYRNLSIFSLQGNIERFYQCRKDNIQHLYQNKEQLLNLVVNSKEELLQKNLEEILMKQIQIEEQMLEKFNLEELQRLGTQKQEVTKQKQRNQFLQSFFKQSKLAAIIEFQNCLEILLETSSSNCDNMREKAHGIICDLMNELIKELQSGSKNLKFKVQQVEGMKRVLDMDGEFGQQHTLRKIIDLLKKYQHKFRKNMHKPTKFDENYNQQSADFISEKLAKENKIFEDYYKYILYLKKFMRSSTNVIILKQETISIWEKIIKNNKDNKSIQELFYQSIFLNLYKIQEIKNKLDKEFEKIKKDLTNQQIKLSKLETIMINKRKENELLSQKCKEMQIQNEEMKKKIKQFSIQKEQCKQMIQQLQKQIKLFIQKITQFNPLMTQSKTQMTSMQKNKEQCQIQLKKIQNKIEVLQNLYKNLQEIDCGEKVGDIIQQYEEQLCKNKVNKQQIEKIEKQIKDMLIKEQNIKTKIFNIEKKIIENQVLNQSKDDIKKSIEEKEETIKNLKDLDLKLKNIVKFEVQLKQIEEQLEKLKKSTQNNCSCLTNHKCDMKCQAGCPDSYCSRKSGHEGTHACELQKHRCLQKCVIDERCSNKCQKLFDHEKNTPHDCQMDHKCQEPCNYCNKKCQISKFQIHEKHICLEQKCPKKCIFCQKPCDNAQHNHDDETQTVTIKIKNEKGDKNEEIERKLHLCGQQHACPSLCNFPGICKKTYKNKKHKWSKDNIDREYDYVQQIELINQCVKKIPAGMYKHKQDCQCDVQHTCTYRCPDCRSLCFYNYNHSDQVKHEAQHRNQESLIYATTNKDGFIKLAQEDSGIILQAGEISLFYNCVQSCQKKGRGHYHLIQCPGQENCYEKRLNRGAKHSNQVYKPHEDKKYDMLLCAVYWQLHNFKMPVDLPEFNQCNFICNQQHKDKQNKPVFCELEAWHTLDKSRTHHKFSCDGTHQIYSSFQICFLIDVTASMYDYIVQSKRVIQNIINTPLIKSERASVKFAVVGYRDHEMTKSPLFQKLKKLCLQKKKTIHNQPHMDYHNALMSQKVFLQNLSGLEKKYRKQNKLPDFLDRFTQSQKFILKYHYPFYLDIPSSRRMIDDDRRAPNRLYGHFLQNRAQKTLKEYLLYQFDYYINLIDQQERDQQMNAQEWKLLEIQPFTNAQNCTVFLEKLKALGGGDPPQAVFDGMFAAANLNWSGGDNTLRYILHIFDAPPHGRQYDDNNEDYYPDGCPCKKEPSAIISQILKKKIKYIIYPLTKRVHTTTSKFKDLGLSFETKSIDKDKQDASVFSKHATALICQQMQQIDFVNRKQ